MKIHEDDYANPCHLLYSTPPLQDFLWQVACHSLSAKYSFKITHPGEKGLSVTGYLASHPAASDGTRDHTSGPFRPSPLSPEFTVSLSSKLWKVPRLRVETPQSQLWWGRRHRADPSRSHSPSQ